MQWYYLDDQRQQVETDEDGLRRLADAGAIKADTMVWNESMKEWLPYSKATSEGVLTTTEGKSDTIGTEVNPYQSPASAGSGGSSSIRVFAAILAEKSGWIKFVAIMMSFKLNIGWVAAFFCEIVFNGLHIKQAHTERAATRSI
ncbi:MAG: DUF4339 domain-containing protein, partial [Verrucomicrobiota bacterium]